MERRDFLVAILQALFLALFPWLRSEHGLKAAERAAETVLDDAYEIRLRGYYQLACVAPGWNARAVL